MSKNVAFILVRGTLGCCSVASDCLQSHGSSSPGFPVCVPSLHYLSDFAQIHAPCVSDSMQLSHLCCPLVLLPSVFTSITVFCNELALRIRWPAIRGFTSRASLVARTVKHLHAVQETWIQFLGQEDSLEKEMATQSSILAWRIPWTEEPGGLQSMGSQSWTRLSD